MTELHKWEIEGRDVFIDRYSVQGIETMTREEAEARLNEYETLKAATDRLGLEWARQFVEDCDEAMETTSGVTMEIYRSDIELLRAYADILEGR